MSTLKNEPSSGRYMHEGIDLSWEGITYEVQVKDAENNETYWKRLMNNASGRAAAGRVLAIMGPSGAGKTTLMNSLCGRVRQDESARLSGCVFVDDAVLNPKLARCISFVNQDDIIFGTDTPEEALNFSCRMRTGASAEESQEIVTRIIDELGLTRVKDSQVGIPGMTRGVSGGERKRTNIGCELVIDPYVIFLDEPTTGLDSDTALRVGALLKDLARNKGRTVITTIHSPSSELFDCFDDLLLVSSGGVVFHGPAKLAPQYFASVGHPLPPRYNPAEFYMTVLQLADEEQHRLLEHWQKIGSEDAIRGKSFFQPIEEVKDTIPLLVKQLAHTQASPPVQFQLLFARSWRNTVRNPMTSVARTVQTIFLAIFVGLFYFDIGKSAAGVQDRLGAFFMILVNNLMMALMNGLATFPPERSIYLTEQTASSYNPFIYFTAKIFAELPFQILFPLLYSAIVYFMIGLYEGAEQFFVFAFIIVCISNTGNAFGVLVASVFEKVEVAMAVAPITVLPLMLVGGLMANTDRLEPYWIWLTHLSMIRYAFIGLSLNEFNQQDNLCPNNSTGDCQYANGEEVIKFLGFDGDNWGIQVMALLIMMLGLRVLAAISVAMQGYRRRATLNFKAPK